MSWTEKISTQIAKQIKVEESPYTLGQISHGIEIMLLYLINASTIIVTSFLCGVLTEALLLSGFYILHRIFTGGIHLKSVWTCLVGGVLTILAGSLFIAYFPYSQTVSYILALFMTGISLAINVRYAPAEHTFVSTKESIRKICRTIIIAMLLSGCLISEFLVYLDYQQVAVTYALAVFLQSLHLHPIAFQVVTRFEKLLKGVGS